jgi:L-lactate utilization protein LutC
VKARGIAVELVEKKEDALAKLEKMIPSGSTVMTPGSVTLQQIGFEELLKSGKHPWRNFKAEILAEKDPVRQTVLRKEATLSEFYVGSVNAIAESGEIVIASATGSQLSPYAFSSRNVIWVAGAHKIVPTLEDAIRRVREYALPLEDQRMKSVGISAGSFIGKILIFEREAAYLRRNVTLLLVNEVLGY